MRNKPNRSTRRYFLQGRSAVDALEELGSTLTPEAALGGRPDSAATPQTYLVQVARPVMACQFAVFLNAGTHSSATERAVEVLDLVDRLEDQLSVYRHRSEVSLLNATAAARPVSVEARLFGLLQHAIVLHADTAGAFDITTGPLIKSWGFYRREGCLPTQEAIDEALQRVGCQWLELDAARQSVRYLRAGVEINLGAIGKGYALDRCAELLLGADIQSFMLHGGHSSILARGQRDRGGPAGCWSVGLRHPLRADRRLAEVDLRDRALATSGAGTQHFYAQGRRYGHILDPRSGYPADRVLSTTVLASEAAVADALATAFYVLGLDQARAYCGQHPDVAALLTCPGKHAGAIEVHPVGLADDEWRQLSD